MVQAFASLGIFLCTWQVEKIDLKMKVFLEKAESDVSVREDPSKKQQNPSIHIKIEPAQHHIPPPQKATSHSLTGPTDAPARLQQRGEENQLLTPQVRGWSWLVPSPFLLGRLCTIGKCQHFQRSDSRREG